MLLALRRTVWHTWQFMTKELRTQSLLLT